MKNILYVCVHNAGRSQMAEAFTNYFAKERGLDVSGLSAGTESSATINPQAIAAMTELGIFMEGQYPKQLTQEMADGVDRIITMGYGVDAQMCPARIHLSDDWGLDDPQNASREQVRIIRDQIRVKVGTLLLQLSKPVKAQGAS